MNKKMLKKALALLCALAFASAAFAGCCSWTATDGTVTKSFSNCFKVAQDKACNPPAAVMAIVNMAAPLLVTFLNLAVPGTTAYINAANALVAVKTIQNTGCILLTDLNNLIAYLQSADFAQAQNMVAAAEMKKGLKAQPPIDAQPLVDWRAKY